MPDPERALLFVPGGLHVLVSLNTCAAYAEARGYVFAGIVRTWEAVVQAIGADIADVVVVAGRRQLPADRRPRLEIAADVPDLPDGR